MRLAGYTIYEIFGVPRRANTTESVWGIVIGQNAGIGTL